VNPAPATTMSPPSASVSKAGTAAVKGSPPTAATNGHHKPTPPAPPQIPFLAKITNMMMSEIPAASKQAPYSAPAPSPILAGGGAPRMAPGATATQSAELPPRMVAAKRVEPPSSIESLQSGLQGDAKRIKSDPYLPSIMQSISNPYYEMLQQQAIFAQYGAMSGYYGGQGSPMMEPRYYAAASSATAAGAVGQDPFRMAYHTDPMSALQMSQYYSQHQHEIQNKYAQYAAALHQQQQASQRPSYPFTQGNGTTKPS
jgi:hypothetical protein